MLLVLREASGRARTFAACMMRSLNTLLAKLAGRIARRCLLLAFELSSITFLGVYRHRLRRVTIYYLGDATDWICKE